MGVWEGKEVKVKGAAQWTHGAACPVRQGGGAVVSLPGSRSSRHVHATRCEHCVLRGIGSDSSRGSGSGGGSAPKQTWAIPVAMTVQTPRNRARVGVSACWQRTPLTLTTMRLRSGAPCIVCK